VRRGLLVLLGVVVAARLLPGPRDFLLGVATGLVAAAVVPRLAARRRRQSEPETAGTGPLLSELEACGWAVSRDDHIVVGPTGAYLLDERRLHGHVSLADGSLVVRRNDEEEAWRMGASVETRVRASAKDARRLLGAANLHRVRPVVVLWCDFPAQVAEHGGVTYVHGDRLLRWLREQPEIVTPQSLESARSCLRRLEADTARAA
jgi:hypothetical protein